MPMPHVPSRSDGRSFLAMGMWRRVNTAHELDVTVVKQVFAGNDANDGGCAGSRRWLAAIPEAKSFPSSAWWRAHAVGRRAP
jgi:hypothetical protein